MAEQKSVRDTAKITNVEELTSGTYVTQEGWLANYVHTEFRNLTRVNIMGLVVEKESPYSFLIDDGTGTILVTDFSQSTNSPRIKVGQPVLVIGKPRLAQDETIFLAAEIVQDRQLMRSPGWLIQRKQDLKKLYAQAKPQEKISTPQPVVEKEEIAPKEVSAVPVTGEDILEFIKSKDGGEGCSTDEVLEYFGKEVEEHITTLITMGEIFEIRPGFVKVLE
jgi:RPA family protein